MLVSSSTSQKTATSTFTSRSSNPSALSKPMAIRSLCTGLSQAKPRTVRAHAAAQQSRSASGSASAQPDRVLVIGGGFGGLYTAVRLGDLFWPRGKKPEPLLYDLLDGTATENEVAPYLNSVLAPYPVKFIQGKATGIMPVKEGQEEESGNSGTVTLEDGSTLEYDWLVVAMGAEAESQEFPGVMEITVTYDTKEVAMKLGLGAELGTEARGVPGVKDLPSTYNTCKDAMKLGLGAELGLGILRKYLFHQTDSRGVPGVKELAVTFDSYEDAMKKKKSDSYEDAMEETVETICSNNNGGTITVVGAGYAGVELTASVAKMADGKANVQLVAPSGGILGGCPAGQREASRQMLAKLGAKVKGLTAASGGRLATSCDVEMQIGEETTIQAADLVLWTAGQSPVTKPTAVRKGFPLPTTDNGKIMTEVTLRVADQHRIFACGDVSVAGPEDSSSSGMPLAATAQVAFQQADYVAWNLWASINKRPLLPFRYQHLGNMMSLGDLGNAAVALPLPLPIPLKMTLKSSPLGPLLDAAGLRLDDSDPENGVTIEGPIASAIRRAAYLYRQPTNEQRISVASNWLSKAASLASDMSRGSSK
eukprot:gene26353-17449_t